MDLDIRSRNAIVLCAAGGLGGAVVEALCQEVAQIYAIDINQNGLNELVTRTARYECPVRPVQVNLSDQAALESAIDEITGESEIDILVNITGGPPAGSVCHISAERWREEYSSMWLPVVTVTSKVLIGMRERRWGRIVTSTSSGAITPIADLGISNSLRSGLLGWSKTVASEVAPDGVTANVVVPGRIDTARVRALDAARAGASHASVEDIAKASVATIPMGRYGKPEEFADLVTFLASERARYITGSVLRIDGGLISSI